MPLPNPIRLGAFELTARLGKGGMGDVFRATHSARGVQVAVKVLSEVKTSTAAFRQEVRAVARLDHPHITRVFDQGVVDDSAAEASAGAIRAGAPYLAMELARGGTLKELATRPPWPELERQLLDILAALGHAHARGIVHRDLKPGNVLFDQDQDGVRTLKLSDFGIARAFDDDALDDEGPVTVTGTLRYMAPEQILGNWRDEGPWTDLYALGVMTHQLVSGRPLFGNARGKALIQHHLESPPPPVRPRMPVPADLQSWLDRLLAKHPSGRFAYAADAARALRSLSPAAIKLATRAALSVGFTDEPTAPIDTEETTDIRPPADLIAPQPSRNSGEWPRPQLPSTWRGLDEPSPAGLLGGVGLGLYGLRPVPLVGRERERDVLWNALSDVATGGGTAVVAMRGAAGTGKTRLAEWLAHRAHQAGAATTVRANHSRFGGPADGLPRVADNILRTVGLPRAGVVRRAARFIKSSPLPSDHSAEDSMYDALALAELCPERESDPSYDGPRVRLDSAERRYRVMRQLLVRHGRGRPLLLWLDDAHLGADSLRFARYLLASEQGVTLPMLIVLTYRTGDPMATGRDDLRALLDHVSARMLALEPLSLADSLSLVDNLLGLSGDLAEDVAARSEGIPLFAIQLIGDWVHRGLLEATESGFELVAGATASLPDDIHQLWQGRLRQLCGSLDEAIALEVAAALGHQVSQSEWELSCQLADIEAPPQLLEKLFASELLRETDGGWEFTHAMLRETLERNAIEHERWRAHHRSCAEMLSQLYGSGASTIAERQGRHLAAAGELESAVELLLAAATSRQHRGDYHLAQQLFAEREAALDRLSVPTTDKRRAAGWVRQSSCSLLMGDTELARDLVERSESAATAGGWHDILARAEIVRGQLRFIDSVPQQSYEAYHRALAHFEHCEDAEGLAVCLNSLGSTCMWMRRLDEAVLHFNTSLDLHQHTGDFYQLGMALRGLAHVAHCNRDWTGARELYQRAKGCFEHNGNRHDVGSTLNDLGELARAEERLDEAETLYRQAAVVFHSVGSPDTTVTSFNLGLVMLERGDHAGAREIFHQELDRSLAASRKVDVVWLRAGLLVCAAAEARWSAWDDELSQLSRLVEDSQFVDEDIAHLTLRAGKLAISFKEKRRAERALALARSQFEKMKHADVVAEIDALVAS